MVFEEVVVFGSKKKKNGIAQSSEWNDCAAKLCGIGIHTDGKKSNNRGSGTIWLYGLKHVERDACLHALLFTLISHHAEAPTESYPPCAAAAAADAMTVRHVPKDAERDERQLGKEVGHSVLVTPRECPQCQTPTSAYTYHPSPAYR